MPGINYTLKINNTPAPQEILQAIQAVQVENNGDMADIFRLRLAIGMNNNGDWTILQDDYFQPLTPVEIQVQIGSTSSESLISGYSTSQHVEISNEPGMSFLEVVGMDATVLMNLEEKVVSWPNMADSDIASTIFNQYGFLVDIEPTQPVRQQPELTTIQRSTDIRFLRRLAERNGFECYLETDPVINSEKGHFHSPRTQGSVQGVLSVNFGTNTNVTFFNAQYDMLQPSTAQTSDIDVFSKSIQNSQAQTVAGNELGQNGLLNRISQQPVVLAGRTELSKTGELQTLCQAIVDRSASAIKAEGELNTAVYEGILRANRTVNVRGAGDLYSGSYYVSRVQHSFSGDGYTQRFELRRNAIGLTGSETFINTNALP